MRIKYRLCPPCRGRWASPLPRGSAAVAGALQHPFCLGAVLLCQALFPGISAREILNSTPISLSSSSRLVPPEEKNGRLMPVLGISAVPTAICRNTCQAICEMMPMPSTVPYRSGARRAIITPMISSTANAPMRITQPKKPSSSPMTPKIKSFSA